MKELKMNESFSLPDLIKYFPSNFFGKSALAAFVFVAIASTALVKGQEQTAKNSSTSAPKTVLISNFENGILESEMGSGWSQMSDQIQGGKSVAKANIVKGKSGNKFLRVKGRLESGAPQPWAGVIFSPGDSPFAVVDLSQYSGLRFRVRGSTRKLTFLVSTGGGSSRISHEVNVDAEWKEVAVIFSELDEFDQTKVNSIFIGTTGQPNSDFSIDLDDAVFLSPRNRGGQQAVAPTGNENVEAKSPNNMVHPPGQAVVPIGNAGSFSIVGNGSIHAVLIPGMGIDGSVFSDFADSNFDKFKMIIATPAGFGTTIPPQMPEREGASFTEAAWCSAFESALIEQITRAEFKNVILIGYQDGVQHAIAIASEKPELVAGIVSIAGEPYRSFPWTDESNRKAVVEKQIASFFRSVTPEVWKEGMGRPSWYSSEDALGNRLFSMSLRPTIPTMVRYYCEKWSRGPDVLEGVRVPALAILPDSSELKDDQAYQQYLATALVGPWTGKKDELNAQIHVIDQARLGMISDKLDQINVLISEFVKKTTVPTQPKK